MDTLMCPACGAFFADHGDTEPGPAGCCDAGVDLVPVDLGESQALWVARWRYRHGIPQGGEPWYLEGWDVDEDEDD